MDYLVTPWRMAYIRGEKKAAGCVFCDAPGQIDEDALILARGRHVYAILNLFPYNTGHLMIVPYPHVSTPDALTADALLELMQFTNRAIAVLRSRYNAPAFNIGANIGGAAGAGIAEHFHFHIVPRWNGDANFMTTLASARVLPDTLINSQRELKETWHAQDVENTPS